MCEPTSFEMSSWRPPGALVRSQFSLISVSLESPFLGLFTRMSATPDSVSQCRRGPIIDGDLLHLRGRTRRSQLLCVGIKRRLLLPRLPLVVGKNKRLTLVVSPTENYETKEFRIKTAVGYGIDLRCSFRHKRSVTLPLILRVQEQFQLQQHWLPSASPTLAPSIDSPIRSRVWSLECCPSLAPPPSIRKGGCGRCSGTSPCQCRGPMQLSMTPFSIPWRTPTSDLLRCDRFSKPFVAQRLGHFRRWLDVQSTQTE